MKVFFFLFFWIISASCIHAQNINTVAGGFTGDAGNAKLAALNFYYDGPYSMAVDIAGNMYIADIVNHRIRKVTKSTGNISTVAGNGTSGYNGDNISATSAQLYYPGAVTVDLNGNLYISDIINNRVRKVIAGTGMIVTIAGTGIAGYSGDGGLATSAQINYPTAIAVDNNGEIYFSCENAAGNDIIRKISSNNIITTVAGGGVNLSEDVPAALSSLNGLTNISIDRTGNIYVSVFNKVRKIKKSNNNIVSIAGTGTAGYSGDGSSATAAMLDSPFGTSVDINGNVYIADNGNSSIRKVDALTNNISTVAGNGTQGFSDDNSSATAVSIDGSSSINVDSLGNFYFIENFGRVRKVDPGTNALTTVAGNQYFTFTAGQGPYRGDNLVATAAQLDRPADVVVDQNGNQYIADLNNNRVRKVDASTGIITTIAGDGSLGFSGDNGLATAAQMSFPSSVSLDNNGNLYVLDMGNARIRKINKLTGIITTVAGNGVSDYTGDNGLAINASINTISGIAFDSQNNLYIADYTNNCVRKVDAVTQFITTIAGTGVEGYSGDNGLATLAKLDHPGDIAIDASGNIYISDDFNHCIRKIATGTGIITTFAGIGTVYGFGGDNGLATSATFSFPNALALYGNNLYVVDSWNNRIRKIDLITKIITTVTGNGEGGFSGDGGLATSARIESQLLEYPSGLAVDNSGNLYFPDNANNRVRKINTVAAYVFLGTGNWDSPANWSNNTVPVSPVPSGVQILINPQTGGECILNVPVTFAPGASLNIKTGAKFRVLSNVIIN